MSPFTPFLESAGVVILDGGLATELERRGADLRDPLWSAKILVENPELIRQVHEDYFRAGADVGTSASYQASFLGFVLKGINPKQAAELIRLSIRLVQEARDRFWQSPPPGRIKPLVAGSVGCYGAFLADGSEFRGQYGLTVDELIAWHRPRIETLLEAGPDLLACETIPCLEEAEALVGLLNEYKHPAWISFSCRNEKEICQGQIFADAVQIASSASAVQAVGLNCTAPQFVEPLIRSCTSSKLLLAYPNSGERFDGDTKNWQAQGEPWDWSSAARRWQAAGVRIMGGCCRTTPETIRQIREAVMSLP